MRLAVLTLCFSVGLGEAAVAQEALSSGERSAPPVAATAEPLTLKEDEAARWAQNILDRAKAGETGTPTSREACPAPSKKPHGEVRAAVGTGGYREIGGTAIYDLANCGMVAVDINLSEGGQGYHRRR